MLIFASSEKLSPIQYAFVSSCGMGAIGTMFAMVAASLLQRKQMIVYIFLFTQKAGPMGHR